MGVSEYFYFNKHGIRIKECCASCMHKRIDRGLRLCVKGEGAVPPSYLCPLWEMDESLDNAGCGGGGIKRRAYLTFALGKYEEEQKPPSAVQIRNEYKKDGGEIYIVEP